MARTSKANEEKNYEDEIDLAPYIKRLSKRKWWLMGSVIIACLAGYFVSGLIPERYQINAVLGYKGQVKSDGQTGQNLVTASSAAKMVDFFKNQVLMDDELNKEIADIRLEGKEYPLTVTFVVFRKDDLNKFPDKLLEALNQNETFKLAIEQRREYLSKKINSYNQLITEIEEQIKLFKKIGENDSCDSSAGLAELYSTLSTLIDKKNVVQEELDNLVGFVYIADPYFLNKGKPVYSSKVKISAITGLTTLIVGGSLVVFIKEKKH